MSIAFWTKRKANGETRIVRKSLFVPLSTQGHTDITGRFVCTYVQTLPSATSEVNILKLLVCIQVILNQM